MLTGDFGSNEGFRKYVQAVNRFDKLCREEEQQLARRWQEADDQAAGNRLIECNLRYVVRIAGKYRGYGLRMADLVEEGNVGLLKALRRFDPGRNLRFMTYASYWVRAYVLSYVLRYFSIVGVGTGPLQSRMFFRLQGERAKLTQKLGSDETAIDEALANKFKTTPDRVRNMRTRLSRRDNSLDAPAYREGAATMIDLLPSATSNQEHLTAGAERNHLVQKILRDVWHTLDDREKIIIESRLLTTDSATLAELGRAMGLSRERVRQLEERLKGKLRRAMKVFENRI